MDDENPKNKPITDKLMHYGMMACCIVMLLPVIGFFSLAERLRVCGAMHRLSPRSCCALERIL